MAARLPTLPNPMRYIPLVAYLLAVTTASANQDAPQNFSIPASTSPACIGKVDPSANICDDAAQFAHNLVEALPFNVNNELTATGADAKGSTVTVTAVLRYSPAEWNAKMGGDPAVDAKVKNSVAAMAVNQACANPIFRAFFENGGTLSYNYLFSDQSMYLSPSVTSCR